MRRREQGLLSGSTALFPLDFMGANAFLVSRSESLTKSSTKSWGLFTSAVQWTSPNGLLSDSR